ncbi:MAG: hypothetical protein CBC24_08215 [Candidatus Pelagibacter sp. TMED64]|jgi:hypothetical protein|nr:MAG: hypothetical protein CBC24_08215 [Candidatus Pelagibacter sp. TMED64]|tara:strand:+ start:104 stop:523 length:420 start_codon:yes stop_codon:yes gene_type:complete
MTSKLTKRIDMALHIQELCGKHNISVKFQPLTDKKPNYYANRRDRIICIRPTKNTGYYVSALHEIGHIIGTQQGSDFDRIDREVGAWKYAMANAIVWTDTATKIMAKALKSYGISDSMFQGVWLECVKYVNQFKMKERT